MPLTQPLSRTGNQLEYVQLFARQGFPTNPPPMNKREMATCSKSWGTHSPPQAERCSKNTFVIPYRNMTEHSTASIDIEVVRIFRLEGLRFQAHPNSAKQPIQRPSVIIPTPTKTPPLIKCANPLKICFPCCFVGINKLSKYPDQTYAQISQPL